MTYDLSSRLSSITDPEGNKTTYEYAAGATCASCTGGSADSPIKTTDPLGNITQMMFDKNGRVVGVRDRNGNQTAYAYDPLGRLIRKIYPDNKTETYTYDAIGRLLTATNINSTVTFTYDTLGRVKTFTDGKLGKTINYENDKNGNRTKMIDPEAGITNYAYNSLNLLTSLTNPSGKVFSFTYDSLGRRTALNYQNNINATFAYDSSSQLTEILSKLNTTQVTKNLYTYDAVGNRLTNTDTAGTHSYQYDTTNQLLKATHPNLTEAFTYDKNGNRKTETRGQITTNYTHTDGNRIETRNSETYAHDKNGNIISVTTAQGTTTYQYDFENRLIKATMPDGTIAEYTYDALGRRIEKSVIASGSEAISTRYLYDGQNILAEYDENNNLKTKYTHNLLIDDPLAMERSGNVYYYHKDALGSITAITDETGNVIQRYEYDSFGTITFIQDPTFIQPYTFTGREFDPETGLYFYRERTFNSKIGIFHQEDPIGFAGGDVNLFRYTYNSPLNYIDPLGLDSSTLQKNINVGPQPTKLVGGSLGGAINQFNQWGNAYLAKEALDKLYCAIQEKQENIPYGSSEKYDVLHGTVPVRFVGLIKHGSRYIAGSDVKSYPITIDGISGFSRINPFDNIAKDVWNQNPNNQCNKCHVY